MGIFGDHTLPDTLILMLEFWWSLNYPLKRLNENCCTNRCYQSGEFLEAAGKLFSFVGKLLKFLPAVSKQIHQHSTMYLSFLFPDRFVFSQVMFIEGLLFHFHVHYRSALQQHVHLLSTVALCNNAFSLCLEVFIPHHPHPTALQHPCSPHPGSWFWQISFVLYPPWGWLDWDQTDDGNIMFSTRCVSWHYTAALINLLSITQFLRETLPPSGLRVPTRAQDKSLFSSRKRGGLKQGVSYPR
uniref:Transmembrane protein 45B n=1 Tax=Gopherus agassizii TaxID=38772 RepID=A0A452HMD6_9SAUR